MARRFASSSFTCLTLTVTLVMLGMIFEPSHQAPYHQQLHAPVDPYYFMNPYFNNPAAPYYYGGAVHQQPSPAAPVAVQPRLNFNSAALSSLLVQTYTTTSRSTTTITTTATCTRSVAAACDTANAANTLRFPFYNGIQKRSIELKELFNEDDIFPSQVESVVTTRLSDKIVAPRSTRGANDGESSTSVMYGVVQLDSSMSRDIQPVEASQARLFIGSTTTIVILQTSLVTTTRTLTPSCSTAGFFTQCPA